MREIDVHLVELLARISRLYIAASATSATRFFKLERLLALLVGYEETLGMGDKPSYGDDRKHAHEGFCRRSVGYWVAD